MIVPQIGSSIFAIPYFLRFMLLVMINNNLGNFISVDNVLQGGDGIVGVHFREISNSSETYIEIMMQKKTADVLGYYGYTIRINITAKVLQIYGRGESTDYKTLVISRSIA